MVAELNQQNIDSGEKKEISDDLAESYNSNILSHANAIGWLMYTKYKLGSPSNKSPLAKEADCFGIVINYIYLTTGKILPDVEGGDVVNFNNYKYLYPRDKKVVLEALEKYFIKYFIPIPVLHRYSGDILWAYSKNDDGTPNDGIDSWALGIDCGNGQMMTTSDKDGPVVIQLNSYDVKNVYRYLNGK